MTSLLSLLLCFSELSYIAKSSMISIKNAARVFKSKSIFSNNIVNAFRDVSLLLYPREFLCIIGSSGSGKSTLAKCIAGSCGLSSGSISIVNSTNQSYEINTDDSIFESKNKTDSKIFSCYLGLQYRELYDNRNRYCNQYFNKSFIYSIPYLQTAFETLGMNLLDNDSIKIDNLLESQRVLFNIYLEIQKCFIDYWQDSNRLKNHVTTKQSILNKNSSIITCIVLVVILDEYLDKFTSSIRLNVFNKLKNFFNNSSQIIINKKIISTINDDQISSIFHDIRNFESTGILITHSKGTVRDCYSRTAIMNNGRLYDIKANFQKLNYPAQLQLID